MSSRLVRSFSSMVSSSSKRAVWASMVLLHAPAFFGTWESIVTNGVNAELLAQCLGLSVSMLLFALKFFDVAFLRWRTDWRSCVAIGLVIATAHLGLLESSSGGIMWLDNGPLFSAAFFLVRPCETIDRLLAVWARLGAGLDDASRLRCLFRTVRHEADYILCWISPRQPCIPRPPPA